VRPDHLALVYTTQWDGMPNILLEAARAGLPIVAPAIGGIREFMPVEWLVPDCEDAGAYVAQIRRLAEDGALREERSRTQMQQVKDGHSWEMFTGSIRRIPGYLREPEAAAPQLESAAA
jgi:glycosyltransferase involved in cell wall biosynthesis